MSNFVQAIEYEVCMHAKFENLDIYRFLSLITSRYDLLQFSTRK
jgi:hypothetical protein